MNAIKLLEEMVERVRPNLNEKTYLGKDYYRGLISGYQEAIHIIKDEERRANRETDRDNKRG